MTGWVAQVQPNRFMVILGGIIVAGVVLYFLFTAINTLGLADQSGTARVVAKQYHEARTTYTTQRIGNRTQSVPRAVPESYVLQLDIGGERTSAAVRKELYDSLGSGDNVRVIYQRRRITGALHVTDVRR